MKGKILVYRITKYATRKDADLFCKRFYGYTDKSNYGKYKYKRSGFIEKIPHIKLIRGVIIVRNEDANKVIRFLKQYTPEIFVKTINLTSQEAKKFRLKVRK